MGNGLAGSSFNQAGLRAYEEGVKDSSDMAATNWKQHAARIVRAGELDSNIPLTPA